MSCIQMKSVFQSEQNQQSSAHMAGLETLVSPTGDWTAQLAQQQLTLEIIEQTN